MVVVAGGGNGDGAVVVGVVNVHVIRSSKSPCVVV